MADRLQWDLKEAEGAFVLMSYVCGESLEMVDTLAEADVVARFIDTLAACFPDEVGSFFLHPTLILLPQAIPEPTGWTISHWRSDPRIGMSYSYVGNAAVGDDYQALAAPNDSLHFAGEVCPALLLLSQAEEG